MCSVFFFQAEDGIRDADVTGVQTCALPILLELERKGQRWKEPLQRYKGLGEMDAGQLAETTMDPRHRTLRRIRVEDTAAASAMFGLLMGSEVAPRRDFIVGGAAELDPSRIDA